MHMFQKLKEKKKEKKGKKEIQKGEFTPSCGAKGGALDQNFTWFFFNVAF